jgi:hypothetical protein
MASDLEDATILTVVVEAAGRGSETIRTPPGADAMSSSPPSLRSRPESSDSAAVAIAPTSRWRAAVLRGIAAAHIVAGAFDLLRVAGNFALKLPYCGGPLGFTGAATTYLARFIDGPILMLPREYAAFWPRSEWIVRQAQTMGSFLGLMMVAHLAVAMLNVAVGYGLWRRRRWARRLDVSMLSLAGCLVLAHGATLIWLSDRWMRLWNPELFAPLVVAVPILAFLVSPRTGVLFAGGNEAERTPRRRYWWTLSVQWFLALLILLVAAELVDLYCSGPMVEVLRVAVELTEGRR